MTAVLADDPTSAAVLDVMPCYPAPPAGRSPAIDALRAQSAGQGFVIGADGVMLILRRPWLALDTPIAPPFAAHVAYGAIGQPKAHLRCGLIPRAILAQIMQHFVAALPDEAAAFVIWCESTREFMVEYPQIIEATPTRLVYRPPVLASGWHLITDMHSHGRGPAFFSPTDNADDVHETKIALVVGNLDAATKSVMEGRICAAGMLLPMTKSPFAGGDDAD